MTLVADGATERVGEDVYQLLTNVRRASFVDMTAVPFQAPTIDEFVRREAESGEGCPERRAWLAGWLERHPLTT